MRYFCLLLSCRFLPAATVDRLGHKRWDSVVITELQIDEDLRVAARS